MEFSENVLPWSQYIMFFRADTDKKISKQTKKKYQKSLPFYFVWLLVNILI